MSDEPGGIWKKVAVAGLKKEKPNTVIDICPMVSKVFEGDGHNPCVIHLNSSVVLYSCISCICDVHCTDLRYFFVPYERNMAIPFLLTTFFGVLLYEEWRVLSPSLLKGRELDHIVNGMRAFMSNNAA